jgi:predicted kinase
MARFALWTGDGLAEGPPPLRWRETVAGLDRRHGLPLWLLEKRDPLRAAIEASMAVRLDWVALLAEADVRGRICADRDGLLERIELFRLFCEEAGGLTGPRRFASDHSRFVYFHGEGGNPDYEVYDDTRCEVTLLAGLPGAGKDTWAREHGGGLPVIALDEIRRELRVGPQEEQGAVAAEAKRRARALLRHGESFVWNATNATRAMRGQLIELFAAYRARVRIVYVEAPYRELLARNRARREPVPEAVIERLARRLELPDLTEAHAVEWVES